MIFCNFKFIVRYRFKEIIKLYCNKFKYFIKSFYFLYLMNYLGILLILFVFKLLPIASLIAPKK